MAQLVVRNIEDEVKERLRALAVTHGRSLEEEVRVILRSAVGEAPMLQPDEIEEGLGTRIAKLFEGCGIDFEIPRMEDWPSRVNFEE